MKEVSIHIINDLYVGQKILDMITQTATKGEITKYDPDIKTKEFREEHIFPIYHKFINLFHNGFITKMDTIPRINEIITIFVNDNDLDGILIYFKFIIKDIRHTIHHPPLRQKISLLCDAVPYNSPKII